MFQQKEDIALLFARLFIASMFLPSGLEKLFNFRKFSASLESKGLPYSEVWAVLTAAIEVLGPIALTGRPTNRQCSLCLSAIRSIPTSSRMLPSWPGYCSTSSVDLEPLVGGEEGRADRALRELLTFW